MVDVKWSIRGKELVQCNCDYGCPCQFNARPTKGNCQAVLALDIEQGHHGDTPLDGLKAVAIASWPGAIHEGHGQVVPVVDERATPAQREALLRIMSGEDTEPGATFYQVFSTTLEKVHDPVFAKIDLEIDVDGRMARLKVPGWIDTRAEPIVNPVTGAQHRARIDVPQGFEFSLAEVGRGWTTTSGPIEHNFQDTHAHFARLHMTGSGLVR